MAQSTAGCRAPTTYFGVSLKNGAPGSSAAVRPDQATGIWCRDTPPLEFGLRTAAKAEAIIGPSDRDEPALSALLADTPLGLGRVTCFYHPDPAKTEQQGAGCKLSIDLATGVKATLFATRAQITSGDPSLAATIARIPEYWAALTGGQ